MHILNPKLSERLQCPKCGSALAFVEPTLQCAKCGSVYPIEQEVPILTAKREGDGWDYLEHYKTDAEVFDYFEDRPAGTEHEEERLREYILHELPVSSSILDVGCGKAWVAKTFQNKGVFVCSLDATVINTAKALKHYPSGDHAAVVADAFHLPFKEGSFEAVIASEIIEHVVDPAAFVRELYRVLSPGGTLIVTTPYKEVLRYTLCIHCNQNTPWNAHLHSFDEKTLASFLRDESNAKVSWKTFGNKALIHLRTHTLLSFLPFRGWKFVDLEIGRAHV